MNQNFSIKFYTMQSKGFQLIPYLDNVVTGEVLKLIKELRNLKEGQTPILELSTFGGSIKMAYDFQQSFVGTDLVVAGVGTVESAGVIMLLSAPKGKRFLREGCSIHIHEATRTFTVSGSISFRMSDFKREMADFQSQWNMYVRAVVTATGITAEALEAMMYKDVYLTAQEAIEMGFAGYVIPSDKNTLEWITEKLA